MFDGGAFRLDPAWVEAVGWLAAATVFLTFCMKTMPTLRVLAVLSNVAFIAYALFADLMPVLVLHGALLPLNLARLVQMRLQLDRMHRAGREDHPERQDFGWLVPLAAPRDLVPGETLFRKGDPADRLFVVVDGEIAVPEFDVRLGPGALFGEVGVLSADGRRTASARATGHVRLAEMTAERVERLYFDDPKFAWRLIRLVTARLVGNAQTMEARMAAREAALAARERAVGAGPPDAAAGPH